MPAGYSEAVLSDGLYYHLGLVCAPVCGPCPGLQPPERGTAPRFPNWARARSPCGIAIALLPRARFARQTLRFAGLPLSYLSRSVVSIVMLIGRRPFTHVYE